MKHALAAALLLMPFGAVAQTAPAGPVTVEIVASGQVSVPAQRFRLSAKLTAKGKDQEAAAAALAASRAKLTQALTAQGIREAQVDGGAPTSMMSLFAGIGNRNKPTFTQDVTADEDADEDAEPQTVASETVMYDAPSRAAIGGARQAAEANGATIEDEVLPVLADYVTPKRRAKADALQKAQAEADAYASALGLRRATLVKVSEKQDIVGGSLGFVSEIVGMFMPKTGDGASDDVPVNASLTVEYQLSR